MVPLTGSLLGCHCYHCLSVAVMSAGYLLCCPTATVMLPRNPKCDLKSEVLTCVAIQSTCRICMICSTLQDLQLSVCLSLPGFSSKKLQQQKLSGCVSSYLANSLCQVGVKEKEPLRQWNSCFCVHG